MNYEDRSNWRPGTQEDLDDVADLVRERLRWDMRNVTGLSTIIAFRDAVDYWASDPERGQWGTVVSGERRRRGAPPTTPSLFRRCAPPRAE